MNAQTVVKRVAHVNAEMLSTSLRLVDDRVVLPHLTSNSTVHQLIGRALAGLDDLVALLDDSRPGPDAPSRSGPTGPDAAPASAGDPVSTAPAATGESDDAADDDELPADEQHEVEVLTDELLEEQETETFAGELADGDDLRHVQAELRAKHLVEEQHDA